MKYITLNNRHPLMAAALALGAIALIGCSDSAHKAEPELPVIDNPGHVMDIGASLNSDDAYSRATHRLEDTYTSFGVYAFKTMSSGSVYDVMLNADASPYEVVFGLHPDTECWYYDFSVGSIEQYLRYWDFAARRYDFMALAPMSYTHPVSGTSMRATDAPFNVRVDGGTIAIDGLTGNVAASSVVDWLYARHRRDYNASSSPSTVDTDMINASAIDDQPSTLSDPVQLTFHHLQPIVEFRGLTRGNDEQILSITVKTALVDPMTGEPNIQGLIHTVADFAPTGTSLTISDFSYATSDVVATDIINYTDDPADPDDDLIFPNVEDDDRRYELSALIGEPLAQIPQSIEGYSVRVSITTTDRTIEGLFSLKGEWAPDQHYIYYITLLDSEFIIMDVDIEKYKWTEGNDLDIPDPLPNW